MNKKNKFIFQSQFDEKGTKDFLDSKKKALMEIDIDDEGDKNKNEYELENNNIFRTDIINKNDSEENIHFPKKSKISRERTSSLKGKSPKKIKNSKTTKNFKVFIGDKQEKNKKDDSYESNFYKFIIDNANESEDKFYDKLENEIKKYQAQNQKYSPKKNIKKPCKTLSIKKNSTIKKPKNSKSDKNANPFNFCEKALYLMTKEKIEVSGINNKEEDDDITSKDKNQLKTRETSDKNDDIKNNLFNKKETKVQNKIFDDKDNTSDKNSLMSLLSGLIN